jgi:hypothetical protein
MSDSASQPSRPVSLFTIVFLFVIFAAFLFVARHYYKPTAAAPQLVEPENFSKDLAWKATRESRRKELADLRQAQIAQGQSYAWVDQKAGVVQLPIERAMELTAQKYGAKK